MSDTARTADGDRDGVPSASAVVPSVGAVLSAVAVVALLIPLGRGVDDPAVLAAAVAALVAAGAFLAHRHALLERRIAGPVAAGASLLVVLLSGFVITRGVLGSVVLPGLERSVSLLLVAFIVAITAVGVGVAAAAGLSGRELKRRTALTLEMLVLAAIGLLSLAIAQLFLELPVALVAGEPTAFQREVASYLAFAVGLGGVTAGYLALRDRDPSFIDLEAPTLRTVGWIVAGLVAIVAANLGMSALMTVAGIEGSEHSTTQNVADNPDMLVLIIPAMFLLVGPFEELLYRNVVQKSLYGTFSRAGAVVVASVVFASVHVLAYATAGPGELLASLSLVFVLGLILGTIYERTENLVVPAVVHGGYNALVFLLLFV